MTSHDRAVLKTCIMLERVALGVRFEPQHFSQLLSLRRRTGERIGILNRPIEDRPYRMMLEFILQLVARAGLIASRQGVRTQGFQPMRGAGRR